MSRVSVAEHTRLSVFLARGLARRLTRRIISWLSQAPLVLDEPDARFYRRFLRSLTRQVRHLRHTAAEARDGVPRFQAAIALAFAALCMAGQQRHIRAATKRLSDELVRQILPDGGHISRNPGALIELLVDLLPLRTAFTARNIAPPMAVSQEAHAGCLSFELSARQNRIVVNCGLPVTSKESWRQVARATAAHSTATLNDTSSCRFVESGPVKRMLSGVPMIGGPREIAIAREEQPEGTVLRASHDGYAEVFNVIHQRVIMLSPDGQRLDGEDLFTPAKGDTVPAGRDQFAVRFHLHPSVRANRLTDGHSAMLLMPNKEVWTFSAYEDRVDLEESVYLASPDGPRRTVQIVGAGEM